MSLILEEITENTLEFQDITSFRILAGIENENLKVKEKKPEKCQVNNCV